jgi:hypothetical protein
MKTSLLICGNIKIQFSYGNSVRVSINEKHIEAINNLKAFRLFAKHNLNEAQIRLAKINLKIVR